MDTSEEQEPAVRHVAIELERTVLQGDLVVPPGAEAIVLFAHGSGSSRLSPRNRFVARELEQARLATLLFDLLTAEEETVDELSRSFRFDIALLADRLVGATDWLATQDEARRLRVGYFGASTGAAAALVAAARRPDRVGAVVSRGGRPDLANAALTRVEAPTLLIVGGADRLVLELNQHALRWLDCEKRLSIVPDATHLFEEPGALEAVAHLARDWFVEHLATTAAKSRATAAQPKEEFEQEDPHGPFRDRWHAGRLLGKELARRHYERPIVLGIPRGGVPVAAQVAAALDAELGVVVARKLRAWFQPELAVGAVTADGTVYLDRAGSELGGISEAYLTEETERRVREARAREDRYVRGRATALAGRTVIVVDDGVATGSTAVAAVRSVKRRGAAKVVLAVPVGAPPSLDVLREEADEVVCLEEEPRFFAVGQFYRDFEQVDDDEVGRILDDYEAVRSHERPPAS